ncbi:hypothetical protein [Sulfurivirga sp.]|uniref:hypothetical protein n=1 Tax=Sulfurivirga sp. TaxID=2614236 RepID=UPI0025DB4024|nr:hypothetical protein [Sulfurivirga sp.]
MKRRTLLKGLAALGAAPLAGCDRFGSEPLTVSVNAWIGYAPLVYADSRGWLAPLNVRLFTTVSLGESLTLFETGTAMAFSATQYEFHLARRDVPDLVPAILLDRSNGGDGVVGNRTLAQLQRDTGPIDVFLEADSVNREVLDQFVRQHGLTNRKLVLHDQDQMRNTELDPARPAPTLVVTYSPYMEQMVRKGFRLLASTRDLSLLVVDGLFVRRPLLQARLEQFRRLKQVVDRAIDDFRARPETVFPHVREFLAIKNVAELKTAMAGIEWINHPPSDLLQRIAAVGIPVETVLP